MRHDTLGIAVIGAGYWGPNLVRNIRTDHRWELRWVVDRDLDRAQVVAAGTPVAESLERVLNDPQVDAVVIATPAATHAPLGMAAIAAGRHVLIEKPLASSLAQAEQLVLAAEQRGCILMCDHTYCYTPAVARMQQMIAAGAVGDVHYIDSVRVNLGLVQPDVDVFWDLAPHDLSVCDALLPGGLDPVTVAAFGADPLGVGRSCMGYLVLSLADGGIVHVHVNWMSPTKVRTITVGGSAQTLVWDDLDPAQRLRAYNRGVEVHGSADAESRRDMLVRYRSGDMVAPALPEREALVAVVGEFYDSITQSRAPRTDGAAGVRVLRVLEAARQSLALGGAAVTVTSSEPIAVSA
ncbi:MAG: Gfo/Idh/MocA family protein [Acidimicrobiia bacterium]